MAALVCLLVLAVGILYFEVTALEERLGRLSQGDVVAKSDPVEIGPSGSDALRSEHEATDSGDAAIFAGGGAEVREGVEERDGPSVASTASAEAVDSSSRKAVDDTRSRSGAGKTNGAAPLAGSAAEIQEPEPEPEETFIGTSRVRFDSGTGYLVSADGARPALSEVVPGTYTVWFSTEVTGEAKSISKIAIPAVSEVVIKCVPAFRECTITR